MLYFFLLFKLLKLYQKFPIKKNILRKGSAFVTKYRYLKDLPFCKFSKETIACVSEA